MSVVVVVVVSLVAFFVLLGLLAVCEHIANLWIIHTETQEVQNLLTEMQIKALKRRLDNRDILPEGGTSYRDLPDNVVRFRAHPEQVAMALGLLNPEDPDEGHSQR